MSACRSIVTVCTLTIQFRIDERPSHHDSGNEGLMTLKDIKLIALVEKIVCAHVVILLTIDYMHIPETTFLNF